MPKAIHVNPAMIRWAREDAGYSLGSGIRRISENNLCPLKY